MRLPEKRSTVTGPRLLSRRHLMALGAGFAGVAGLTVLVGRIHEPALPRVARVGLLIGSSLTSPSPSMQDRIGGLREALPALGWHEGANLALEQRAGEGKSDQLAAMATSLVNVPVDVLVTTGTTETLAALAATRTLPIVFYGIGDPVDAGLVDSLVKPGGNATGVSRQGPAVYAKGAEVLHQLVPTLSHLVVLWNPANVASRLAVPAINATTDQLGVELLPLAIDSPEAIPLAFDTASRWGADGLMWLSDAGPLALSDQLIVRLAARYHLPAYHPTVATVRAGGLLTYSPSDRDQGHLAAQYVDRLLRGARVGDLPVQQPTHFDFVVNVTTATSLSLTLPADVVGQVTEWVQ